MTRVISEEKFDTLWAKYDTRGSSHPTEIMSYESLNELDVYRSDIEELS